MTTEIKLKIEELREMYGLRVIRASDVQPAKYDWLWQRRIAQNALTILNGSPDAGKSGVYTDIAARVTTGSPMPCEEDRREPGNVLLIATEDAYAEVVRPRLDAAGADVSKVFFLACSVDDDGFDKPLVFDDDGLKQIRAAIKAFKPKLVVIDPFTNHLPPDVDSYIDQEVRRILGPLSLMANTNRCAIVVVRHHTKNGNQGAGSVGIGGIARSELTAKKAKNSNTGVLSVTKYNHTKVGVPDVQYMFQSVGDVARIAWSAAKGKAPEDDRGLEIALKATIETGYLSKAKLAPLIGVGPATAARRLEEWQEAGWFGEPGQRGRPITAKGRRRVS